MCSGFLSDLFRLLLSGYLHTEVHLSSLSTSRHPTTSHLLDPLFYSFPFLSFTSINSTLINTRQFINLHTIHSQLLAQTLHAALFDVYLNALYEAKDICSRNLSSGPGRVGTRQAMTLPKERMNKAGQSRDDKENGT